MPDELNAQVPPVEGQEPAATVPAIDPELKALMDKMGYQSPTDFVKGHESAIRKMNEATQDSAKFKKTLTEFQLLDPITGEPLEYAPDPGYQPDPVITPPADEDERLAYYKNLYAADISYYHLTDDQIVLYAASREANQFATNDAVARAIEPFQAQAERTAQKATVRGKDGFDKFNELEADIDIYLDANRGVTAEQAYWIIQGQRSISTTSQPSSAQLAASAAATAALENAAQTTAPTGARTETLDDGTPPDLAAVREANLRRRKDESDAAVGMPGS